MECKSEKENVFIYLPFQTQGTHIQTLRRPIYCFLMQIIKKPLAMETCFHLRVKINMTVRLK